MLTTMTGEAVQHGVEAADHAAEAAVSPGDTILHHILDSHEIEIPLTHKTISLPEMDLGWIDLSITKHVVMMWLAFAALLLVFGIARRQSGLVPTGLRNALEAVIVYMRDEVARRAIHGKDADRYVGFLLSTFFFILFCNLLGLIPGLATATANISVTAGLAFASFLVIQVSGILHFGPVKHVKNLLPNGLPVLLVPLMFVLEILAQFIRPFALCIRLFANMMAGHVVILAFVFLIFILKSVWFLVAPVSVAFVLGVNFLELMVAFLQAYIFTMLTAQFIGMSLHPTH